MRRDVVFKAINFQGPAYVPICFFNTDFDRSDIVVKEVQHHFQGDNRDVSEWGFTWQRYDETMGQPNTFVVESWEDLTTLKAPDPAAEWRFEGVAEWAEKYADRYRVGSLGLSGFTSMWCLRSFGQLMIDIAAEPDRVRELADIVFGFEEALIRELPQRGFDAIGFFDDWGTQEGMIISPKSWRKVFKPYYQHQFDLVHSLGMHVYFHCCGQFMPIIPDLIEVGVDILNISQPNVYDIAELGERFGGQVCFLCPVSYQTTSLSGTREEIFTDVQKLVDNLGCYNGGLIGYVEEYASIGLSQSNYDAIVEAFQTLGQYP